jgi:hypothetical protein
MPNTLGMSGFIHHLEHHQSDRQREDGHNRRENDQDDYERVHLLSFFYFKFQLFNRKLAFLFTILNKQKPHANLHFCILHVVRKPAPASVELMLRRTLLNLALRAS